MLLTTSLKEITAMKNQLQNEIGTELLSQLTENEQNQLKKLNEEIDHLKSELIETSKQRTDVISIIFFIILLSF